MATVSKSCLSVRQHGDNLELGIKNVVVKNNQNINIHVILTVVDLDQVVTDGAVVYRIQLGAFKGRIPYSAVKAFIGVFEQGIDRRTNDSGYQVFYSGNYTTYASAVTARDEAIAKGVKDAFIVALVDGKRVPITDAMSGKGR